MKPASAEPVRLDENATARIRPEAVAAMVRALEISGNASSVHAAGRAARAVMEAARADVAALVGAAPQTVVFTSGGTEANALAIASAVAKGAKRILISAVEHDAVRANALAAGVQTAQVSVDGQGVVDLGELERALRDDPQSTLVCIMAANNETGVIQPAAQAARLCRAAGARLHVDAVQAAGKIALDMSALGAHSLALSAHKLGGPQGVGALVLAKGEAVTPNQRGGGQERGLRAGTENVAGVAGFGAAARAALNGLPALQAQAALRDAAQARMVAAGGVAIGADAERLPQTLCIAAPAYPAEMQVISLDLAGVLVSAGAACSSGKVKASGVLMAMGLESLAGCAIRVSGGWATTAEDWDRCARAWIDLQQRRASRRLETV